MSEAKQTKNQFMARKKIASLPAKEKNRRWEQYKASRVANRTRSGYSRNTSLKARKVGDGYLAEMHLTPCAKDYFLALNAPFSHRTIACVPDLHAIPSKKVRIKTRGNFTSGSAGNGFIMVNSWANANDTAAVYYSGSTYAPAEFPATLPPAGTTTIVQPKVPYTALSFANAGADPGVQARTVASALRIRYTGPALYKSGQIFALRQPDNQSLVNRTFSEVLSYSTCKTYRNKGEWITVMWRPTAPTDYEFSEFANGPGGLAVTPTAYPKYEMGFGIAGTTGSAGTPGPASFEFEHIRYVEYIGNIDNISRTHVDVVGMSHVRNAMEDKSSTDNSHSHFASAVKRVEDSIGESLPAAVGGGMAYKQFVAGAAEESPGILATLEAGATSALEMAAPVAEAIGGLFL